MKLQGIGLGLLLLSSLAATTCAGQSTTDPGSGSTSNSAKPAATPQDTSNSTTGNKKPKKVWTNDEIGSVKGAISVVGDSSTSSNSLGQRKSDGVGNGSGDTARNPQVQKYRDQIQQVRSQMDEIDKRIAQLRTFKAENTSPSSGININQGYNMVPIEDQVKRLEDKKKQLEGKIEDIEGEARKNGIDPGDLR